MKKMLFLLFVLMIISGIAYAGQGNNLPPGPRYMLNVIAYDKDHCPAGDFTGSNRHMIAVQADFGDIDFVNETTSNQGGNLYKDIVRANTISLSLSPDNDFRVSDGNACSKGGAEFMLPADPYMCDDGDGVPDLNDPDCINEDLTFQEYRVFVRLVGRPGTGIGATTCAVDELEPLDLDDDIIVCSTESVVKMRMTGKGSMKFADKTKELLTLCLDTTGDSFCDTRVALFDSSLYDYFWQWNTSGKAHAQLVFIPIPD